MDRDFPPGMVEEIREFLAVDSERRRGQDIYPEVFETAMMFPLQRKGELAEMMRVARSYSPRTVMEIGADKAGGLYHWIKCLPTVERVIACEIRGTPYAYAFEEAFPEIDFLWIEDSSYATKTLGRVERWLGSDRLDVLFIDGDKSMFDHDFDLYLPFMNRPGVVFMHDITDEAPGRAFVKSRADYRYSEIYNRDDTAEALARESQGISSANAHESWLRHWRGTSCGVGVIYLD